YLPTLQWNHVFSLVPSFAVIFLVGLIDDIVALDPWHKLAGQVVAAGLACAYGVQIESVAGHSIGGTWWHIPLTMAWLVGCANAFNLIDGVDGLAAGVGLFATLTTLVAALLEANSSLALATALLAGALLGFLRYNFNPASIFLGDCGSLPIGFLLGCFGIIWSQKAATLLGMTAPLIALCIPILEVGLSIVRRLLRGQPLFGADRRHIHHRLLDLGFSSRTVALMMYGAAGIAAGCSLLVSVSDTRLGGAVVLLFCVGAWIGVQHLGYGEFEVARHVLFGGVVQRVINGRVTLQQLDAGLASARTTEERWQILTTASRKMGFNELDLDVDGEIRTERLGSVPARKCWKMQIPLYGSGAAGFYIPIEAKVHPATLASFAAIVWHKMGAPGELAAPAVMAAPLTAVGVSAGRAPLESVKNV
ncbi:MAG TPA: MraY family glycosyltransferase, partial [Bryobacteraceae bacterium]|nr:MraY family glycosyltransferase [Bryobacteraceae bacterium]